MNFLKRLFGKREEKKPLVRCPQCGKTFENMQADNPLDALMHSLQSTTGESNDASTLGAFGLQPTEFKCPHCGKVFKL